MRIIIRGPQGSGKTRLLSLLAGLVSAKTELVDGGNCEFPDSDMPDKLGLLRAGDQVLTIRSFAGFE